MDQKWVQIIKRGSKYSEMDPVLQKWTNNGPEMGPFTRNESETNRKQVQIIRNGCRKSVCAFMASQCLVYIIGDTWRRANDMDFAKCINYFYLSVLRSS